MQRRLRFLHGLDTREVRSESEMHAPGLCSVLPHVAERRSRFLYDFDTPGSCSESAGTFMTSMQPRLLCPERPQILHGIRTKLRQNNL